MKARITLSLDYEETCQLVKLLNRMVWEGTLLASEDEKFIHELIGELEGALGQ